MFFLVKCQICNYNDYVKYRCAFVYNLRKRGKNMEKKIVKKIGATLLAAGMITSTAASAMTIYSDVVCI